MKKMMVISIIEGVQCASFFDKYEDAEQYRQDVECGIGGLAHLYELNNNNEYEFLGC